MPRNYPRREGYSAQRSNFGWKNSKCPRCNHDSLDHFWWHSVEKDDEVGCHECRDSICTERKEVTRVSAVNLCERCGALMLGKAVATLDIQTSFGAPNEHIEICPGCVTSFMDWYHSSTTPMQATPYRDPWKEDTGKTESQLMLENGYCGDNPEGGKALCLRPKGHDGNHRDGDKTWGAGY